MPIPFALLIAVFVIALGLQVLAFRNLAGEQGEWWSNLWRALWAGTMQRREWYTERGWRYIRAAQVCVGISFVITLLTWIAAAFTG